jgi:chorismate mutase
MNEFANELENYRTQLSYLDNKIIELLNQRASISKEIGILKVNNSIEIFQNDFWEKAQLIRSKSIESTSLNVAISNQIFDLIHQQSLLIQEDILKQKNGK